MSHTPGPWRVASDSDRHVETIDGLQVASIKPLGFDFVERWGETVANARLIAAAPELLEVVKEVVESLRGCPCEPCDKSRLAIQSLIDRVEGKP